MKQALIENLNRIKLIIQNSQDFQPSYFNFHWNRYYYLLNLIDNLSSMKNGNILDLGANPYHLSMCLKNFGFNVLGINYDFGQIEREAEKNGVIIKTADLALGKIPVADNYFDYVLFSETLEHFNFHPGEIIKEIHRILKSAGKVIITTPNLARLNNRIKLFFGKSIHQSLVETTPIVIHHREFTGEELISLLKQANFKITLFEYADFNYPGNNIFIKIINRFLGLIIRSLKPNIVIVAEK